MRPATAPQQFSSSNSRMVSSISDSHNKTSSSLTRSMIMQAKFVRPSTETKMVAHVPVGYRLQVAVVPITTTTGSSSSTSDDKDGLLKAIWYLPVNGVASTVQFPITKNKQEEEGEHDEEEEEGFPPFGLRLCLTNYVRANNNNNNNSSSAPETAAAAVDSSSALISPLVFVEPNDKEVIIELSQDLIRTSLDCLYDDDENANASAANRAHHNQASLQVLVRWVVGASSSSPVGTKKKAQNSHDTTATTDDKKLHPANTSDMMITAHENEERRQVSRKHRSWRSSGMFHYGPNHARWVPSEDAKCAALLNERTTMRLIKEKHDAGNGDDNTTTMPSTPHQHHQPSSLPSERGIATPKRQGSAGTATSASVATVSTSPRKRGAHHLPDPILFPVLLRPAPPSSASSSNRQQRQQQQQRAASSPGRSSHRDEPQPEAARVTQQQQQTPSQPHKTKHAHGGAQAPSPTAAAQSTPHKQQQQQQKHHQHRNTTSSSSTKKPSLSPRLYPIQTTDPVLVAASWRRKLQSLNEEKDHMEIYLEQARLLDTLFL